VAQSRNAAPGVFRTFYTLLALMVYYNGVVLL